MKEQAIILSLQKRWKVLNLLSMALMSLAFAVVLIACLHQLFGYSFAWMILIWFVVFALMIVTLRSWRIQTEDVIIYLNRSVPQLEESSGLLLKTQQSLNLLEQLQVNKLKENIQYALSAHPVGNKLKRALVVLLIAIVAATVILFLPVHSAVTQQKNMLPGSVVKRQQNILPAVTDVAVNIKPPAYTAKQTRTQHELNIIAEEGAMVYWEIQTNKPLQNISLQFSDTTSLQLHAINDEHTIWKSERTIKQSGFYQLDLGGHLSDLYKLEMIKDQPPVITVQSPKPSSIIDFGEPQRAAIEVNLTDDYGITDAAIMATVASGSGEAMKFNELEIKFPNSFSAHNKSYAPRKMIELSSLGMKPGDELYVYIEATDNNHHQTQSDTYIISIADTAELMSFDGVINGINLKPEYFRSQRQIIIETEQLLKEKSSIMPDAFNNKSNDLGIDQKLLRLRYGKFLGEEFEADIGEHEEGEHDGHEEPPDANTGLGNSEQVMDAFSHKHDIAEDATFFDAETKKQLKAVLAEMWKAELRLRTFKPAEALPFEYKALRLLKDLQQQSRVYVAKTNIKTPPLKPETRLSGELDKIISPSSQNSTATKNASAIAAQQTLSILQSLKTSNEISTEDLSALHQTSQLMMQQTAITPGKYLAALQSYRRILNRLQQKQAINQNDIITAQKGLQQMVAAPARIPTASTINSNSLSNQYFINLNKDKQ